MLPDDKVPLQYRRDRFDPQRAGQRVPIIIPAIFALGVIMIAVGIWAMCQAGG